jgi:hypothetical protein
MKTDRDFETVAAAVEASALFRVADRIASAVSAAAYRSAAGSHIRDAAAAVNRHDAVRRVRAIALVLLTVSIVHPLLLLLVPPHVAPGVPTVFWMIVAAGGGIVLALAPALVTAWPASAARTAAER